MTTRVFKPIEPSAAKVPEIGVLFWVIKILTTGMGEAASDFMAKAFLPLAAIVGIGGFWYALKRQFRSERYEPVTYWFAVSMVAVFGTMAADGVHLFFFLPYPVTTALYAGVTATVLILWYRSEGTLSIHSITTTRRETFYWTTVLATFALGTAAGDLTAATLHLGFFASGLLFTGAILLPAIGYKVFHLNPVVAFWTAYVLTRPLGASYADWLGKPHSFGGGLGLGDGAVTGVAVALIVGFVYVVVRSSRNAVTPAAA